jgi:hypothetical protein
MPYLLLGILTLGTGLGIGLGLSEGPLTHTATTAPYWGPCSTSRTQSGVKVSCRAPTTEVSANSWRKGTSLTSWFSSSVRLPKTFAACMTRTLNRVFPNGISSSTAEFQKGKLSPNEWCMSTR